MVLGSKWRVGGEAEMWEESADYLPKYSGSSVGFLSICLSLEGGGGFPTSISQRKSSMILSTGQMKQLSLNKEEKEARLKVDG